MAKSIKLTENTYIDSSSIVYNKTKLNDKISELENKINVNRLWGSDLNTIKYPCLCGVDNTCTNWIGGWGYLICIPLSIGAVYAFQMAFNEDGKRATRACVNGTTWTAWSYF